MYRLSATAGISTLGGIFVILIAVATRSSGWLWVGGALIGFGVSALLLHFLVLEIRDVLRETRGKDAD